MLDQHSHRSGLVQILQAPQKGKKRSADGAPVLSVSQPSEAELEEAKKSFQELAQQPEDKIFWRICRVFFL